MMPNPRRAMADPRVTDVQGPFGPVRVPSITGCGTRIAARPVFMRFIHARFAVVLTLLAPSIAAAQTPPKEPPPLWDVQVGASFVGASGNSETSTLGADFSFHRRWPLWQVESAATAVRATDRDIRTAERYVGSLRADRVLWPRIGL